MRLIIFIILILSFANCSRINEEISTQYYSITIPTNWQYEKESSNTVVLTPIEDNGQVIEISITSAVVQSNLTFNETWEKFYLFITHGKKVIRDTEKEYNGVIWKGVVTDNSILRSLTMFTIKDNVRYLVIYSSKESNFNRYEEDYEFFMKNIIFRKSN